MNGSFPAGRCRSPAPWWSCCPASPRRRRCWCAELPRVDRGHDHRRGTGRPARARSVPEDAAEPARPHQWAADAVAGRPARLNRLLQFLPASPIVKNRPGHADHGDSRVRGQFELSRRALDDQQRIGRTRIRSARPGQAQRGEDATQDHGLPPPLQGRVDRVRLIASVTGDRTRSRSGFGVADDLRC